MSTWTNILDLVYPVGSLYQSVNSSSPASLFGGTWTRYTDNSVLSARKSSNDKIDTNLSVSFCVGDFAFQCWDVVTKAGEVISSTDMQKYVGGWDSTNNVIKGWVGSMNGDSYATPKKGSLLSYNPTTHSVYEESLSENNSANFRLKLFSAKPQVQSIMYIKPVYMWKRTA